MHPDIPDLQYELVSQKAVDVGLAFHLVASYYRRKWNKLVLVAFESGVPVNAALSICRTYTADPNWKRQAWEGRQSGTFEFIGLCGFSRRFVGMTGQLNVASRYHVQLAPPTLSGPTRVE